MLAWGTKEIQLWLSQLIGQLDRVLSGGGGVSFLLQDRGGVVSLQQVVLPTAFRVLLPCRART